MTNRQTSALFVSALSMFIVHEQTSGRQVCRLFRQHWEARRHQITSRSVRPIFRRCVDAAQSGRDISERWACGNVENRVSERHMLFIYNRFNLRIVQLRNRQSGHRYLQHCQYLGNVVIPLPWKPVSNEISLEEPAYKSAAS